MKQLSNDDFYTSIGCKNVNDLIKKSWAGGKNGVDRIVEAMQEAPEVIEELINVFVDAKNPLRNRSAWVVDHLYRMNPQYLKPYLDHLIRGLKSDPPDAVKRCTMRIFSFEKLHKAWLDDLSYYAFQYLENAQEGAAIRIFSMTILYRICEEVPELKDELVFLLEEHLPYGTAGFKNRGTKILAKLRKL